MVLGICGLACDCPDQQGRGGIIPARGRGGRGTGQGVGRRQEDDAQRRQARGPQGAVPIPRFQGAHWTREAEERAGAAEAAPHAQKVRAHLLGHARLQGEALRPESDRPCPVVVRRRPAGPQCGVRSGRRRHQGAPVHRAISSGPLGAGRQDSRLGGEDIHRRGRQVRPDDMERRGKDQGGCRGRRRLDDRKCPTRWFEWREHAGRIRCGTQCRAMRRRVARPRLCPMRANVRRLCRRPVNCGCSMQENRKKTAPPRLQQNPFGQKFIRPSPPYRIMEPERLILTTDEPEVTVTRSSAERTNSRVFIHITYPIVSDNIVLDF